MRIAWPGIGMSQPGDVVRMPASTRSLAQAPVGNNPKHNPRIGHPGPLSRDQPQ
jgi:hypothetical protein